MFFALLLSLVAHAQIDKLCVRDKDLPSVFAKSFLDKVPMETIHKYLDDFEGRYGKCQKITHVKDTHYRMELKKAYVPLEINIDKAQKISGLFISLPVVHDDSFEMVLNDLKKFPGTSSLLVIQDNHKVLASLRPDDPLNIASTAKLYILKAIVDEIEQGKRNLHDLVTIQDKYKTLPSGILQEWPAGSQLTLSSMMNLMISESDNTATDHLLFLVGREKVEALSPRNVPFLSIGDSFKLEWAVSKNEVSKFFQASLAEKRKSLERMADIPNEKIKLTSDRNFPGKIGWYASNTELCHLIYSLKGHPSLGINAGVTNKKDWKSVGFKGGSMKGILQMTYIVQDLKKSQWSCVAMTVNDLENVKEEAFSELIDRLLNLLQKSSFNH